MWIKLACEAIASGASITRRFKIQSKGVLKNVSAYCSSFEIEYELKCGGRNILPHNDTLSHLGNKDYWVNFPVIAGDELILKVSYTGEEATENIAFATRFVSLEGRL